LPFSIAGSVLQHRRICPSVSPDQPFSINRIDPSKSSGICILCDYCVTTQQNSDIFKYMEKKSRVQQIHKIEQFRPFYSILLNSAKKARKTMAFKRSAVRSRLAPSKA